MPSGRRVGGGKGRFEGGTQELGGWSNSPGVTRYPVGGIGNAGKLRVQCPVTSTGLWDRPAARRERRRAGKVPGLPPEWL